MSGSQPKTEALICDTGVLYASVNRRDEHHSFPLGAVDAAVIAIAERLHATRVGTLDHRHFHAIKPAHAAALTLLP